MAPSHSTANEVEMPAVSSTKLLATSGRNLSDDLQYINRLLSSFGLEDFPFLQLFPESVVAGNYSLLQCQAQVCSILIQLLHSKQKENVFRQDSEARIVRLMEEIRNLEGSQKRQEDRLKLQERELANYRQGNQVQAEKTRANDTTIVSLKEELNRLKQTCTQKERQFQVELRKREREFEKLKDQLAAVLKDTQLREQRSEMQPVGPAKDVELILEESKLEAADQAKDEDDDMMNSADDRVAAIEGENYRLRQMVMYNMTSLMQLIAELFPESPVDESIVNLIEASPVEWIEETVAVKLEDLLESLKNNLVDLAEACQNSVSSVQKESVDKLTRQYESAVNTINVQSETIKLLESKVNKTEDYRKQVEQLQMEKNRLEQLLLERGHSEVKLAKENCQEQSAPSVESNIPATPKWMKK